MSNPLLGIMLGNTLEIQGKSRINQEIGDINLKKEQEELLRELLQKKGGSTCENTDSRPGQGLQSPPQGIRFISLSSLRDKKPQEDGVQSCEVTPREKPLVTLAAIGKGSTGRH